MSLKRLIGLFLYFLFALLKSEKFQQLSKTMLIIKSKSDTIYMPKEPEFMITISLPSLATVLCTVYLTFKKVKAIIIKKDGILQ